jgi:hypothetical protein
VGGVWKVWELNQYPYQYLHTFCDNSVAVLLLLNKFKHADTNRLLQIDIGSPNRGVGNAWHIRVSTQTKQWSIFWIHMFLRVELMTKTSGLSSSLQVL